VSTDVTKLGVEIQAARCDVLKHDASLAACFFPLTNGAIICVKVARIRDKGWDYSRVGVKCVRVSVRVRISCGHSLQLCT